MAGSWKVVADTDLLGSKGVKVSLKGGNFEEFKITESLTRIAAQVYNVENPKYQSLEIGYWLQDGNWVPLAEFAPGVWLYVRPL